MSNPEIIQKWTGGIQGTKHSKTVLNITLYHDLDFQRQMSWGFCGQ